MASGWWSLFRSRRTRSSCVQCAWLTLATVCFIFVIRHLAHPKDVKQTRPKALRSRLERDVASLLKRLPPDPLLSGDGAKAAWPKDLELLRASVFNGPMLITAPHGIPLWRGDRLKGNEPGTSSVAWRAAFMDPLRGFATALTWRDISITSAISRSARQRTILDPNYLLPQQTFLEPWSVVLRAHFRAYSEAAVLVDIHGMADTHDSDCTVGIAPWNRTQPTEASSCQKCIVEHLAAIFPAFRFRQLPYFTGDWDDRASSKYNNDNGGRMTLSKQSALLGMRAVQLEMTMRLRNAILGTNTTDPPGPRVGGWRLGRLQEFADTLRVCVLRLSSSLAAVSTAGVPDAAASSTDAASVDGAVEKVDGAVERRDGALERSAEVEKSEKRTVT